jgi:ATP-dependent helicase/nuclease subunit A
MKTEMRLPDQSQRDIILNDLNSSILVEAAAGTGKTTSMVGRMIRLIATNKCSINSMAAVTFTRKAASELRSRFQVGLEKELKNSSHPSRKELERAVENIDSCFIGTIHSFCSRLLRERPVEAGVDIDFREIDESQDSDLLDEAWERHVSKLYASNHPVLTELEDLGLEIEDLHEGFKSRVSHPDIDEWPCEETPAPDIKLVRNALDDFLGPLHHIIDEFPSSCGSDKLIPQLQKISRMFRQALPTNKLHELFGILEDIKANLKTVKKHWPGGAKQAEDVYEQWNRFRSDFAEPMAQKWREHRYRTVMRAIAGAIETYDEIRRVQGKLNFQDLLMKAAGLLRDKPIIRKHFRKKFSHILVDEFQDTDPIQAEVIMLLAADSIYETDWRKCKPRPGALFVVGDPKQSIYRFRRADIVTYNQVKSIIEQNSGRIVSLATNFRSSAKLIDWINLCFENEFSRHSEESSPNYVPLLKKIPSADDDDAPFVQRLPILGELSKSSQITDFEAEVIAKTIANLLELSTKETEVAVSQTAPKNGFQPQDFMILTYRMANLSVYADKLSKYGIPHSVTGGSSLNQVRELKLLYICLRAVLEPQNPVSLVAALRSEAFGFSDVGLYEFKRHGGLFDYHSVIPAELSPEVNRMFHVTFSRFCSYEIKLRHGNIISGIEHIISDLGLAAMCAARPGGNANSGSLFKAIDLIRKRLEEAWSIYDVLEYLGKIVNSEEKHDAVPAKPNPNPVVRVMNLHKAKGLEARIVFLADPSGRQDHSPTIRIDRSGPRSFGYLLIDQLLPGGFQKKVLAQPPNWQRHESIERKFKAAEDLRLLYVAATRAGEQVIISIPPEKRKTKNPWAFFEPYMKDAPDLPTTLTTSMRQKETLILTSEDVTNANSMIRQRWINATTQTYASTAAKSAALGSYAAEATDVDDETLFTRGEAIHIALEHIMKGLQFPVRQTVMVALAHMDLSESILSETIEIAEKVLGAPIWSRAASSSARYVEVPFSAYSQDEQAPTAATVMRGVIDLVFREPDGWVIVDYKTDKAAKQNQAKLTQLYEPQLKHYVRAWRQMTGEPVKEAGFFFTETQSYVTI